MAQHMRATPYRSQRWHHTLLLLPFGTYPTQLGAYTRILAPLRVLTPSLMHAMEGRVASLRAGAAVAPERLSRKRRCNVSGPQPKFADSSEALVSQHARLGASGEGAKWAAVGREAIAAIKDAEARVVGGLKPLACLGLTRCSSRAAEGSAPPLLARVAGATGVDGRGVMVPRTT